MAKYLQHPDVAGDSTSAVVAAPAFTIHYWHYPITRHLTQEGGGHTYNALKANAQGNIGEIQVSMHHKPAVSPILQRSCLMSDKTDKGTDITLTETVVDGD